MQITAGGRRFSWKFLQAEVAFPIIGADFLANFKMAVDLSGMQLLCPAGLKIPLTAPRAGSLTAAAIGVVDSPSPSLPTVEALSSSPSLLTVEALGGSGSKGAAATPRGAAKSSPAAKEADSIAKEVEELMAEYPSVVNAGKKLPKAKHQVKHVITTTCPHPVKAHYRRLDKDKLAAAEAEFLAMEQQGIVRRSKSNWASPLHMVRKKDGTWRPCGDYRQLNLATKPDLYPPPHMEDLSTKLEGMKHFTTIDLRKGYWQIPVAAKDVEKTAVITPFGLWEFLRMPFGLKNAGQTFQRFVDNILAGIPHVFVYMDDILVASPTAAEHKKDVQRVMEVLEQHGLVINREKCQFQKSQVEFLGHLVDKNGIRPLPAKVEAITKYPRPTTCSQLLSFLGMINFYRRFIRGAASILKPLTDATKGGGPKHRLLDWRPDMEQAFREAKVALSEAAILAHPQSEPELSLAVDASDHHVGGVLQQKCAAGWQPLAFFSRKLNAAETRYSTLDRELLACVAAIRHFRCLVEGRAFTLYTDHKPLTYLLAKQADAWSARQQRHLAYVAEYTADIQHVPGVENVVADALSRPPAVAAVVPPASTGLLNWAQLATGQATCGDLAAIRARRPHHLVAVQVEGYPVWCDVSAGLWRPVVPVDFRRQVFDTVHGLVHPGVRATTRLVSNRFVWPGLATDIKEWCRECVACCRAKVTHVEHAGVEKIPIPGVRFSHVHVDLVGPLPASRDGSTYLLTMIDRSTRWPEAVPLSRIDVDTVLEAFITTWVARFGVPARITTDRGTQFTSGTWGEWCREQGVQHITTTAYHPQANGMVERIHRTLKAALCARGGAAAWKDHLPWVLLGMRAAPREETGVSAAEAALQQQLVVPGQLPPPGERPADMEELLAPPAVIPPTGRSYAQAAASSPLDGAEWVYVAKGGAQRPMADKYSGPYQVLERGNKAWKLQVGDKIEVVSRDRLKAHLGRVAPEAAVPPRRGRPRTASVAPVASSSSPKKPGGPV